MLAIIGGSGLTKLANLEVSRRVAARTPYGDPSGAITCGKIGKSDVLFLARHGYGHTIPPHEVNYRANLWALRDAGADSVAVYVTMDERSVVAEIADDGCGGARPSAGSGLVGLRNRVETLGGRLTIVSPEGGGTRLHAHLPLDAAA